MFGWRRQMLRGWLEAGSWLAIALFSISSPVHGGELSVEDQVKAACLLNFAKFTEWPEAGRPSADEPFRIGVLEDGEFAAYLRTLVIGREIQGSSVEIVLLPVLDDSTGCQMLFLRDTQRPVWTPKLTELAAGPVLVVGETDSFATMGGTIGFWRDQNKVRFEVNVERSKRAGLQISSKLLSLARIVRD